MARCPALANQLTTCTTTTTTPQAAGVDKRGRKVEKSEDSSALHKYYKLDKDEARQWAEGGDDKGEGEDSSDEVETKLARLNALARGDAELSSSGSSSSDDEDEEGDAAAAAVEGVTPGVTDEDAERSDIRTRRLAAVNMDWEHVNSTDILAALQVAHTHALLRRCQPTVCLVSRGVVL